MKITKAVFDLMPAQFQTGFKANPTNADEYDNGEEAVDGLKTALAKEKLEREAFGKKLAEYDTAKAAEIQAAQKKALDEARTSGDFAKVEADYKRQLKELQDANIKAESDRLETVKREAINNAAGELAKMFVSPTLATAAIKSRLSVDIVDGKSIVRVLDKSGNASASSLEDLRKEYLTEPEYKPSIVASKGSGGGSTQPNGGGGSTPVSLKDFKTATEEATYARENPEAYAALPEG